MCVRLLGLLAVLVEVIAPVEALHAASGVENALLSREERVALRADVNLELRLGAADLKGVAARAGDGRLDVVWMDVGLHATPAASRRLCSGRAGRTHDMPGVSPSSLVYHKKAAGTTDL